MRKAEAANGASASDGSDAGASDAELDDLSEPDERQQVRLVLGKGLSQLLQQAPGTRATMSGRGKLSDRSASRKPKQPASNHGKACASDAELDNQSEPVEQQVRMKPGLHRPQTVSKAPLEPTDQGGSHEQRVR